MSPDRCATILARLDALPFSQGQGLAAELRAAPWAVLRRKGLAQLTLAMTRLGLSVDLTAMTVLGSRMRVPMPALWDVAGFGCYADRAEINLVRHIVRHVPEGATVIDVGANVGFFSVLSALAVGPSGRVFAFEPGSAALRYLRTNTADHPAITVVERALLDREGEVGFHEAASGAMVSSSTVAAHLDERGAPAALRTVAATSLDAFTAAGGVAPDFIKLDIEGAELAALTGAQSTLSRHHPDVAMEVAFAEYEAIYRPCVSLLLGLGYRAHAIDDVGTPQLLPPDAIPARAQACTRARGYLHGLDNLLFRHPGRGGFTGAA